MKVTLTLPFFLNLIGILTVLARAGASAPALRFALAPLPFALIRRPVTCASPLLRIRTRKVAFRFCLTLRGATSRGLARAGVQSATRLLAC